jgi:hypothetical protein
MAVKDVFKFSWKTFINPAAWIGYNGLVEQNKAIYGILTNLKTVPQPGVSETFEEAMKRQGLTEKDLQEGISTYSALALVFLMLGLAALAYAIYLLGRYGSLLGTLLGVVVAAMFAAQAFKYDFWALQMRKRTLGLTFEDWKRNYLGK